jgi:hypothetical protein
MSPMWLVALTMPLAGMLAALPAAAQLHPQEPDPLAKIRAAADGQACSTAETSACAQANPKILAAAMGPSPLEENLRKLQEPVALPPGRVDPLGAAVLAEAAFREAGVDNVRIESDPRHYTGRVGETIVAEIRGSEKPEEFVVLGAPLFHDDENGSVPPDIACNAAMLIEAARDVHVTGLRPLRSIRFALFFDAAQVAAMQYLQMHTAELDHAVAAVIFEKGCSAVNGFSLGGRVELEPAVRQALDFAPIKAWEIAHDTPDASEYSSGFDFLLEGIPTLVATRGPGAGSLPPNLDVLRRNTAVAGILAFALAEHATPPGPRLTRDEIDALLVRTGLKEQMRGGVWDEWESGKRGRQP